MYLSGSVGLDSNQPNGILFLFGWSLLLRFGESMWEGDGSGFGESMGEGNGSGFPYQIDIMDIPPIPQACAPFPIAHFILKATIFDSCDHVAPALPIASEKPKHLLH